MAITHVKVTYSVQPGTAQRVQELATKWGVPKSEVIRRAVEGAAKQETLSPRLTPRQALARLMSTPSPYTRAEIRDWKKGIQSARRASDKKSDDLMKRAWERSTDLPGLGKVKPRAKSSATK